MLTRPFKPYIEAAKLPVLDLMASRCLLQVIHPKTDGIQAYARHWRRCGERAAPSPAHQYEALCQRFGSDRINRAVRQRILNNQLWRAFAAERQRKEAVQPVGRSNLVREPAL